MGAVKRMFQGLPWESWTNVLGRSTPLEDEPPEQEKTKVGVMKLPKEDMKIFGLCPERDPFTVVVCERCNMCVKPQAFLHHYEMRHMNKDIHPPQPNLSEVTVSEKVSAKVEKPIVRNPFAKPKTKKITSKDSLKGKEGVVTPTPSLPMSLTLETHLPDHATCKGETLQPVVALTPLVGTPVPPAVPVLSKLPAQTSSITITPPAMSKTRRPPQKHAPIKEREYDPDKHCGVVTLETMKPCTWSLTCKSHQMSLRRAVVGRSKPFDQLLADQRQAKEALLKQKKTVEMHNSSMMFSLSQPEPKVQVLSEKPCLIEPVTTLLFRLPELNLDVTLTKRIYLSSPPQSLVVKSSEHPNPPLQQTPTHVDVVAFTLNHPKALNAIPMFSSHKIGGLVYTNRCMQIARQGLESCLYHAGNSIYMASHGRKLYTLPRSGMPSTLSSVLNNITSHAAKGVKRSKPDKPAKSNKKVCLSKEAKNLINLQINNLKSVLSRQDPNTINRLSVQSTTNTQFHIPNILNNALKRS